MKWTNVGHELNRYANIFVGKEVLIYGAGAIGQDVNRKLSTFSETAGYIDRNKAIENRVNKKVYSLEDYSKMDRNKYIVVLAGKENHMRLFARQLLMLGAKEGADFFFYYNFLDFFIYLYALFGCNKVYSPFISFQVSSVCNLRCEGCAGFTDRREHGEHYSFEQIKKDMDNTFSMIDGVGVLDLCGGEPTLFPLFPEIVNLIMQYRKRIDVLRTVINATTIPSHQMCEAMHNADMTVIVDDYRENVKMCNETFSVVCDKLEQYGIKYQVRRNTSWINILGGTERLSEEEVILFFNECNNIARSIHGGKLFLCDYAHYASDAKFILPDYGDYLCLENKYEKSVVTEFLMGYSEKGYCNMCRYCNGYVTINQDRIPVAKQQVVFCQGRSL